MREVYDNSNHPETSMPCPPTRSTLKSPETNVMHYEVLGIPVERTAILIDDAVGGGDVFARRQEVLYNPASGIRPSMRRCIAFGDGLV